MRRDGDTYTEVWFPIEFEHTPNSRRPTLSLGGTMLRLRFLLTGIVVSLKVPSEGPKGKQSERA